GDPLKAVALLSRVRDGIWRLDMDYRIKTEILQHLAFSHVRLSRLYRRQGLQGKSEAEMVAAAGIFREAFDLVKDLMDKTPMAKLMFSFGRALLNGGVAQKAHEIDYAALKLYMSKENEARDIDFHLLSEMTHSLGIAYLGDKQVSKGL